MEKTKNNKTLIRIIAMIVSGAAALYFNAPFFMAIASWFLVLILLEKITGRSYNSWFEYFILVFLILSNWMGGDLGFYDTIPWWDEMLHFTYGFTFAFLGYRMIVAFLEEQGVKKDPLMVVVFSLCFSIALGAVWEIYEYAMDTWFGDYFIENGITLMQEDRGSGEDRITDTMNDIILETASALTFNVIAYISLTNEKYANILDIKLVKDAE